VPLALVRAAEAIARGAVAPAEPVTGTGPELAGAVFLAEAAVRTSGLPVPVPADRARDLAAELLAAGLEREEVVAVLPQLPLAAGTADVVLAVLGTPGTG
jgi:hypothetical protein